MCDMLMPLLRWRQLHRFHDIRLLKGEQTPRLQRDLLQSVLLRYGQNLSQPGGLSFGELHEAMLPLRAGCARCREKLAAFRLQLALEVLQLHTLFSGQADIQHAERNIRFGFAVLEGRYQVAQQRVIEFVRG